ncbi:MAG: TadE/TadG family type IV pilus assembly protein [Chloroflexota bacterium]
MKHLLKHRYDEIVTSKEDGQSVVELALVLLLILTVTFGIIDSSRAIYAASVVNAAAQEGARAGIIDPSTIMTAIETKMIGLNIDSAAVNIDTTQPDIIEVGIVYDFTFITPIISALVTSLELTGQASMVIQ